MNDKDRFKARVAYRMGAKPAEIAESTEFEENEVTEYVERMGLERENLVGSWPEYEKSVMEIVDNVYNEWKSPDEAVESLEFPHFLSKVIADEQPGKVHWTNEKTPYRSTANFSQPPATEDSLDTFLNGQEYISEEKVSPTQAAKWYIQRTGGEAPESELADFLEVVLQYKPDDPTGRFLEEELREDEEVSIMVTDPEIEDPRYNKGEIAYLLKSEPEIEDEVDQFLNGSMLELSEKLDEEKSGMDLPIKKKRMRALGIENNGRILRVLES